MRYALQELVSFIAKQLNPAKQLRAIPSDEQLQAWSSRIALLCSEAQLALADLTFAKKASSFSSFIEQYQRLVIRAMDMLYADKLANDRDPTKPLREDTIVRLDGIYRLLADSFARYFRDDEKMPNWRLDGSRYRMKCCEKKLRKMMAEKQVNETLAAIVLHPYRSFMDKYSDAYTQCSRYVYYLEAMGARIQQMLAHAETDGTDSLLRLLLSLNFNHPDFINYYYTDLTHAAHEQKELSAQLPILYECRNKVNRTICHPTLTYIPEMPSAKEETLQLLSLEISGVENLLLLDERQGNSPRKKSSPGDNTPDETLQVLGVPVDLYSVHKRVERIVGMLTNENQTQMCNGIAKNCLQKDLRPVAAHSFRQSYYSPTRKTIEDLQKYYKKMLLVAGSLK